MTPDLFALPERRVERSMQVLNFADVSLTAFPDFRMHVFVNRPHRIGCDHVVDVLDSRGAYSVVINRFGQHAAAFDALCGSAGLNLLLLHLTSACV